MYKEGKAQRNAKGEITKAASYQSKDIPTARIEPNRKWFTNTRVVSQDSLSKFREAMEENAKDPYQVLLKSNKLPMTLIRDGKDTNGIKQHQAKMAIETAPFSDVFGPKAQRKRVKLGVSSLDDLVDDTVKSMDTYEERMEQAKLLSGNSGNNEEDGTIAMAIEPVFDKGQSKRIWNELYKVIDSSDVVIHVLDARDPISTRCRSVEKYLRDEAPHKHLIFVLNKCDLVPTGVAVSFTSPPSLICRLYSPGRKAPNESCQDPFANSLWRFVCYNIGRSIAILDCHGFLSLADVCRSGYCHESAVGRIELNSLDVRLEDTIYKSFRSYDPDIFLSLLIFQ
jgi:nuclear GTP-binding protein